MRSHGNRMTCKETEFKSIKQKTMHLFAKTNTSVPSKFVLSIDYRLFSAKSSDTSVKWKSVNHLDLSKKRLKHSFVFWHGF
jgi:hypothetical protein